MPPGWRTPGHGPLQGHRDHQLGRAAQVAGRIGVRPVHQPLRQAQRLQRQLHHLKGGPGAVLQGLLHGLRPGRLLLIGALGHSEHGRHGVEGLRVPLHHVQEPVLQVPGLFQGLPCQAIEFGVLLFAHGQRPHHGGQGCAQGPGQCRGRPAAGSRCVGAQQVRKAPYRQFRKLHDVLLIPCPPGDTPSPAYGSQNSPASGSIPHSPPGPWPGSGPPAPCR